MNREILNYLSSYASNTDLVNKFLVSLFVALNNYNIKRNELIKSLVVHENDKDIDSYENFYNIYRKHQHNIDFTELIQLFEHSIPKEDRTINGIVYTPKSIKSFIINETIERLETPAEDSKFCDLACGCGGFLYTIAKKLKQNGKSYLSIFERNIYGLDIKDYSILRTKILLSLLAISEGEDRKSFDFNLAVGNALGFDWFEKFPSIKRHEGFDSIVGNPPYVTLRNMDEESKVLLKNWIVAQDGNSDLYIPFFEIGDKYLKQNGILGYITVNSFFRTLNARTLRLFFQAKRYDFKIIDFGHSQIFGKRSTYTCLCFIKKQRSDHIKYAKATLENLDVKKRMKLDKIKYNTLDFKRGWLLSSEDILTRLRKIESAGDKLINLYKIRTGISTLANNLFIFKPVNESRDFYFIKQKEGTFAIEKAICKDIINPNNINGQSTITEKIEKIIFPYHKHENMIELFDENYFKTKFPNAYDYLSKYKEVLLNRDKGKGNYKSWYAFGRSQSLTDNGNKLLFQQITTKPRFVLTDQRSLLFYNGQAIYSESISELTILKKILESDVFKYYIENSSKPYNNGYYSLAKNYIKHFSICDMSDSDKKFLLKCTDSNLINDFLAKKYGLKIKSPQFA